MLFDHANHYILIENAYFIPTIDIRLALSRALSRGVRVAVILARDSDVPLAAYASRTCTRDLESRHTNI